MECVGVVNGGIQWEAEVRIFSFPFKRNTKKRTKQNILYKYPLDTQQNRNRRQHQNPNISFSMKVCKVLDRIWIKNKRQYLEWMNMKEATKKHQTKRGKYKSFSFPVPCISFHRAIVSINERCKYANVRVKQKIIINNSVCK